jgi:hypothetical protein
MSEVPPPAEADEHRHKRRDRIARVCLWSSLAAGIAAATVTVPPMVDGSGSNGSAGPTTGPSSSEAASVTPSPISTLSTTSAPAAVGAQDARPSTQASSTAAILKPVALATDTGSIGAGQSVLSLGVQDLSGQADDWTRYVEFSRHYRGRLTYLLPDYVKPASVTGVNVRMNYRGPAASTQTWRFQLCDWRTGAWVTVGGNDRVTDWGSWTTLVFTAPGGASDYISPQRNIKVQLVGGSTDDTADIDYLATVVTYR